MMAEVLAFENRGEWYFVAESKEDLAEMLAHDGFDAHEVSADQCDACGSFDPETGEPGRGFLVREKHAECACCGRKRPIHWHDENETVF